MLGETRYVSYLSLSMALSSVYPAQPDPKMTSFSFGLPSLL